MADAARVPVSRSPTGRSRDSPTKSLLDSETSTGHPVATSSSRRRVRSRESCVVLPKSWAGSITMLSLATPAASARSAYAVVSATALATTSAYSIRCGRVRGVTPPVWVHTMPTSYAAATSTSPGSAPPQASLIRSAPASQTARATGARQVSTLTTTSGWAARTRSTKRNRAPHLLVDVDLLARRCLDAADVDDLGTLVDDLRHPVERLVLRPRRTLVVEGVRGPVDDRHHQSPVVTERVPAETERHARIIPPGG